jgi:hypothetical protein
VFQKFARKIPDLEELVFSGRQRGISENGWNSFNTEQSALLKEASV